MRRPDQVASFFMDLNLLKLQLCFETADTDNVLSLVSSASRFESDLKGRLCSYPGEPCATCQLCRQCSFVALCGRQLSTDPEITRIHQKPGLPYLFSRLQSDSELSAELELLLLGNCINLADELLSVFGQHTEQFDLRTVRAIGYQQEDIPLLVGKPLSEQDLPVLSAKTLLDLWSPEFINCKKILIRLTSPLRLLHDGRELRTFLPDLFAKGCLRRLSSLAAYYGEPVQQVQLRQLFSAASDLKLLSSEELQLKQRAVSGSFRLSGDFTELGPILRLAGMFHLGKGASYCMGDFEVTVAD